MLRRGVFASASLPLQWLVILLCSSVGALILSGLSALWIQVYYGVQFADLSAVISSSSHALRLGVLRALQSGSALGMFVLGGWWSAWLLSAEPEHLLGVKRSSWSVIGLGALAMLVFNPFIAALGYWNMALPIPAALEDYLRQSHNEMIELITALTAMEGPLDLGINLLVMAAIPAIGEELLFRGAIQGTLLRATGKTHLAVWLTALGFALLHSEPFNLFPLVFLGAALGYLRIYSGSIWPSVTGHFLNNAALLVALYMGWENRETLATSEFPGWSYVIASLALGIFLVARTKRSGSA